MDKKSPIDCFLYFMWNRYDALTNDIIFHERASEPTFDTISGQMIIGATINIQNHIWNMWCAIHDKYRAGAPAVFYAELDYDNRKKIVEYAIKYYNENEK